MVVPTSVTAPEDSTAEATHDTDPWAGTNADATAPDDEPTKYNTGLGTMRCVLTDDVATL